MINTVKDCIKECIRRIEKLEKITVDPKNGLDKDDPVEIIMTTDTVVMYYMNKNTGERMRISF